MKTGSSLCSHQTLKQVNKRISSCLIIPLEWTGCVMDSWQLGSCWGSLTLTCLSPSAPLTLSQCLQLKYIYTFEAPAPLFESTYHSSPHAVVSEWERSVTDDGGRQDGSFILWELFQCQTPVLSVFSGAESWSVFVWEEDKVLRLIHLKSKVTRWSSSRLYRGRD